MSTIWLGPRGGGGGGSAVVGALMRQDGEDDKGLFVSHRAARLAWHLQAEGIAAAEAAAAATLAFENQDQDADLNVTLPLDWVAPPETANSHNIVYDRFPAPAAAVKAQYDYGRLNVKAATAGAIGNRYILRTVSGRPATADSNARTDVGAWAGNPGILRRNFRITSPNSVDPAVRASALYRFGSRNNGAVLFRVQWHEAGTAGNGFQINAQVHRDNSGTEQTVATYAADNRSITVVITGTAARRNEYPWAETIAAINAARTAQGNQLVVADVPGGSSTSTNFLNMPSTDGQTQSMTAAGNSLPNQITLADGAAVGTTADNTGADTNRGGVRVVTGDPSLSLTGASVDVNVAGDGDTPVIIRIVLTGTSRGAAGNNIAVTVRYDGDGQTNSIFARGTADSSELIISINGTAALGTLLTELNRNPIDQSNGDNTTIFATATIQSNTGSSLNVTWGASDATRSYQFSGGTDAGREPLSAVWDAAEHRLTITAVATDNLGDVFPIIAALDQFQTDNTGPGYVRLRGSADATNVIRVQTTVGDHYDYAFSNGSDGAARTPLAVREFFLSSFEGQSFYRLDITGALNTDTIQNVIDAYTAGTKNFELAPASGSGASDTITGNAINTSLTGGSNQISRRLPVVTLADTGVITIGLHAVDDDTTNNSTLAELRTAWHAVTYTNTEGTSVVLPNTAATVDTTDGGAAADPVRAQSLPTVPTGGRNEVIAGVTEVLVRPEDEVDGPNILLRYDPTDDLQTILEGFTANSGGANIQVPYGTDLTASPEAVPFTRSFYDSGAEAPTSTSGGLTRTQVDARVRALAKGYALKGGPVVPDSDLDSDVARDAEIPNLFRDALNAGNLSAAFTERIPYLAGQTWETVDLQALRQRIKLYVGAWSDTPGFFVFREGDLTEHNDQLYWINAQTTKDLGDGPETNSAYTLLSNHMGDWVNRYTKAGTTCGHNGIAYIALTNIAENSGEPQNNAGWLRISENPNTVVDISSKPSEALTFTQSNAGGDTEDVTLAGADDSVTGLNVNNHTITVTKRDGSSEQGTVALGDGTLVLANPTGTTGDNLTRVRIGGTDYNIPQTGYLNYYRPTLEAVDTSGTQNIPASGDGLDWVILDARSFPGPFYSDADFTTEWNGTVNFTSPKNGTIQIELITDHTFNGKNIQHKRNATRRVSQNDLVRFPMNVFSRASRIAVGSYTTQAGETVNITEADLLGTVEITYTLRLTFMQRSGNSRAAFNATNVDITSVQTRSYQIAHGAGAVPVTDRTPSISSFSVTGDTTPVAGSIQNKSYNYAYQVANGDNVGAARIIGFKGGTKPSGSATVLATLSDHNHGSGSFSIAAAVTLAADEFYTVRIQIFDSELTTPSADSIPVAQQDFRITAHAAATAPYHWGYVAYDANDADAAATAARVDFANDIATYTDLPSQVTITVPTDGAFYQLYLAAKSDQTQPAGFTSAGVNASGSFYDAQTRTISSVEYKIYVLKPLFRSNSDDNGETFGITPPQS